MKYTHKVKLKDGSYAYRFVAPKDAKLAGVVKNESFRDGRRARHEIPKLVQIVEDFRKGKVLAGNISINSNFMIKYVIAKITREVKIRVLS